MKTLSVALLLGCALYAQAPPDAEIRSILADRIDVLHRGVGISAGVIDSSGRRYVNYGSFGIADPRPVGRDTIYEIGSITKVFTSLLLADMVQRGEVSLDDPVAKHLPAGVKLPERDGHQITLVDLATQSSGLPRMPSNFAPKDPNNPYADYPAERMYEFLAGYTLPRDIGSKYEYSNLGVGLLGNALAHRAGMSYEALVRTRITGPLHMDSTAIALTPAMKERLARGHGETRQPAANWDLTGFAGAGALRSDTVDMLQFLAANLGYVDSPLSKAMSSMTKTRRAGPNKDIEIALNWHITHRGDREIVWHNGGTGGYRTWAGYDAKAKVGVVVLSNMSTAAGVDDIGLHLVDPSMPLAKLTPIAIRKEVTLDPKVLDTYVGAYQLIPGVTITVTRDGTQMFSQLTGQPKFEIFAEKEREFFFKVVDAQLTFEEGAVVLHQNGRDQRAKRQ
jgi:CubicO group peptidase (beta-lactamase class C family)